MSIRIFPPFCTHFLMVLPVQIIQEVDREKERMV